ncbi:glutamate synthase subunit beta [Streptomyces sp. ICBB 8177]|uniref:glutamate synthase subunit beta n=1 Tax=Streptomyces sp. ICBB 8177 TaxID=563922 RepID=UPI000D672902|nr:glutamate synthase subunit beta [Streptomyces sp. ICBB 8177]PWI42812.1 glutamate synthase [Streptomyces sp. ICBB 8177]
MAGRWGFLTTPRVSRPRRPVAERLADWREVHDGRPLLPVVSAQAGRCMDCGIPFCHAACPLGNLIPEWNLLVEADDWAAASERLHATNNFPEFTGRLCPAPCEDGCVLAIDADPVTIKDVEVAIADQAWREDRVRPVRPRRTSGRSVAVIGSGPAGLAAAQQLVRAGHAVDVYERDDRAGGLLRYGIPDFKMEKRHLDRRLSQLTAEGVRFHTGAEVGARPTADEVAAGHDAVVVAIGATAWRELPVPGRELAGVHQAMEYLPQANRVSRGEWSSPPVTARGKHVVIVGGGDTAADCLGTALRQRAASVVQLDIRPHPGHRRSPDEPWPTVAHVYRASPAHEEGQSVARAVRTRDDAATGGLPLPATDEDVRVFSASTVRFEGDASGHVRALRVADSEPASRLPLPGTERSIPAQLVLLALGFTGPPPDAELLGQLGLRLDARGTIARDPGFGTARPEVFVAGDAGRGQSLIVWAIAEGRSAAAAVDRYLMGTTDLPAPVSATDRPIAV